MRLSAGLILGLACGVGISLPAAAASVPSYAKAERCADASGFTARAMKHPDYAHGKVYATPQELTYINRCVAAASGRAVTRTRKTRTANIAPVMVERGTLPLPRQYPLMSGDTALWPSLSMAQQRRAMLFLQSGSTIQSSLLGD